jgi:hypothetical protein
MLCTTYQVSLPVVLSLAKSKCGARSLLVEEHRGILQVNCSIDEGIQKTGRSMPHY